MTGIKSSTRADRNISDTVRKLTKKTLLVLILISCSLTVSGCVYLRLLKVKRQFKQFDKYVMVDKKDGLTLSFLQPILYEDDIKWLGLSPVFQETKSGVKIWRHVLKKIYNNNPSETGNYDLVIDTRYQNKKLHALYLPERYFKHISKDFFIFLFKYMGNSDMDLDKANNTVRHTGGDIDTKHSLSLVKQDNILKMLGVPYLIESKNGTHSLEYHYKVQEASSSTNTEEKINAEYVFTFIFSKQDSLITVAAKIPILGTIELDFSEPELHSATN
ncbi:MAG: hypothetical protein D3922_05450 [Candidatus Electrothrix sp. AR1]|nr:hypothetical protein [Candidatus Electrothrix sp. AR1]